MKNHLYCYFHRQLHDAPRFEAVEIGTLEDANSVQMAIQQIVRAVVSGTIDHKTAGLALYGLQTAAMNLPHCDFEPNHDEVIVDDRGTALEDIDCDDDECLERDLTTAEPVKVVRKGNHDPERKRRMAPFYALLAQLEARKRERTETEAANRSAATDGRVGDPADHSRAAHTLAPAPSPESPTDEVRWGGKPAVRVGAPPTPAYPETATPTPGIIIPNIRAEVPDPEQQTTLSLKLETGNSKLLHENQKGSGYKIPLP
jgi:hypothetical protein